MSKHALKYDTVVVGAGQAGLAMGYYLEKMKMNFLIVDGNEQVGSAWSNRWDSLKLFTPLQYNKLPGMKPPQPANGTTSKDDMARYLQAYADKFDLPILSGQRVSGLYRINSGYVLETRAGAILCNIVIVATGSRDKKTPSFAGEISPGNCADSFIRI